MVSSLFTISLYTLLLISSKTFGTTNQEHENDPSDPLTSNKVKTATVNTGGPESDGQNEYVPYKTPNPSKDLVYLYESFDDVHRFKKVWVKSEATKGSNGQFKYDGTWDIVVTHQKIRGDYGLRMRSKSKHHTISRHLDRPFNFSGSSLIVQYDVQYRNGQECGGAYIKLLSAPSGNLSLINDQSVYTIMFGPDKCGSDNRLHFIFAHIDIKTGTRREIHWKDAHSLTNLADIVIDGKWHTFRLHVNPSNSFEISMDKRIVASGSLLTDFSPPVNPPIEIDDPDDVKPEDWDEREKVPDPDAVKPDDWENGEPEMIPDPKARKPKGWLEDEPLMIPDSKAVKPKDWSNDKDGVWSPPMIESPRCSSAPGCGPWKPPMTENPKYKGQWSPPLIANPAYQGKWVPRKISNPDYFEDNQPYSSMNPIDAVTFELWTLSDGIIFDNILITSDLATADSVLMSTYQIKKELNDLETDNWFKRMIKQTNKKPWLWAVYIVATAVPVIFFIGFCCVTPGSSSSSPSTLSSSSASLSTTIASTSSGNLTCSSTTISSTAPFSSIFQFSHPSTSLPSMTNDSQQQHHHHNHQPFTENCKADHHLHHHDQNAFRYHDACKSNDSDCSMETVETIPSGLRSRIASGSGQSDNITGYCSSSYTHHSTTSKATSFSFKSACMKQVILNEEEEEEEEEDEDEDEENGHEDEDLIEEMEILAMKMRSEVNKFDLKDIGEETNQSQLDESEDYYDNSEKDKLISDIQINRPAEYDQCEGDLDGYHAIDNGEEREGSKIQNDQLAGQTNGSNLMMIQADDVSDNGNDDDNVCNQLSTQQSSFIDREGFTERSDLLIGQKINGNHCIVDNEDNGDVTESNERKIEPSESTDIESPKQSNNKFENSSVRRRKKGRGRHKNDTGSKESDKRVEGGGGGGGHGRSGNGRGKNRRTKARRE